MTKALFVLLFLSSCNKATGDQQQEIARLKAELAAKQIAPNPQPETAPPAVPATANTAHPVPDPADVGGEMLSKIATGSISENDFVELVKQANANKSITYAHLKKNADRYSGKPWRLYGRIVQITEHNGFTTGQINLTDYGQMLMHFEGKLETDFVERNAVEMVGLLGGNFSYKAVNGWDMEVPQVFIAAITKRGGLDKRAGIKHRRSDDDE